MMSNQSGNQMKRQDSAYVSTLRTLRSRRGTAYIEYFLAAAAMAVATMAVATRLGSPSVQNQYLGIRDGVMDEIGGDCRLVSDTRISC